MFSCSLGVKFGPKGGRSEKDLVIGRKGSGSPDDFKDRLKDLVIDNISFIEDPVFVRNIGELVVRKMRYRTLAGQDINGHELHPYSRRHKAWKMHLFGYCDPVNLRMFGHMLTAIEVKEVTRRGCKITVAERYPYGRSKLSTRGMATIHNFGTAKMPRRSFFGWQNSSEENVDLMRMIKNQVRRYLDLMR